MKKCKYITTLIILLLILSGCEKQYFDEPCEWCDEPKTQSVEKEDGGTCYVCDNHRTKCLYCGKKAKKHYSGATGLEVFVCNACYEEDMELREAIENGEFDINEYMNN